MSQKDGEGMKQPLISFIVPVYGAEKTLERCVQSVLAQEIDNWELILVDDESPDASGELCEKFSNQDVRIRVIHRKNGGQGAARNTGANVAMGKWLMFIDDDDWIDKNMSKECIGYLTEDIDILVFSRKEIYKNTSKIYKMNLSTEELCFSSEDEKHMLQINILNFYNSSTYDLSQVLFAVPWGKFFRRAFWEQNKLAFIEGSGEDRPCLLMAYGCARKTRYINKCYYNYWIHESTVRNYIKDAYARYSLSLANVHEYTEKFLKEIPTSSEALRHTDIAYFSHYVIQDYCHRMNPQTYQQRKHRFQHDLRTGSFLDAFQKADFSCLPFRKRMIALLIRNQNFLLIDVMCRVNDLWNKVRFN